MHGMAVDGFRRCFVVARARHGRRVRQLRHRQGHVLQIRVGDFWNGHGAGICGLRVGASGGLSRCVWHALKLSPLAHGPLLVILAGAYAGAGGELRPSGAYAGAEGDLRPSRAYAGARGAVDSTVLDVGVEVLLVSGEARPG